MSFHAAFVAQAFDSVFDAAHQGFVALAFFGVRYCSSRLGQGLFPVLLILAWGMRNAWRLRIDCLRNRPALRISREALP